MKSSSDAAAGNGSKASTSAATQSISSRFKRFFQENVSNLRKGKHIGELEYKV